ncbi:MAG: nucleotidyltransferase [Candidatus Mycalebacterium zealandia]|nr:MAG: nucleotidyltransferase [Candidatus Mycalebacterium zealandia]
MEETLQELKNWKAENANKYGILEMGVFGSVARGEATPESDVDVVIKLKQPNLYVMIRIERELGEYLKKPVDVVSRNVDNLYLKRRIERDMVVV